MDDCQDMVDMVKGMIAAETAKEPTDLAKRSTRIQDAYAAVPAPGEPAADD